MQHETARPESTGFLVAPNVNAKRGQHHKGGFPELVSTLKSKAGKRPAWWSDTVTTEQVLNPLQLKTLPKDSPDYAEWRDAKKRLTDYKRDNLPLVRAPGKNGDPLRLPPAYAPWWDVLLLDFDGVPPVIDDLPTIEAVRNVLDEMAVRAVIHTTPTHSEDVTKLRIMVHTTPLAMAPDGKGYEPSRGMDERYHAAVLLEHAIIGGLGAKVCRQAKHNSPDCRYVLDTGEEITADRTTYKAAQPFYIPFDDAQWLETEGAPVSLDELHEIAAPYGFPLEVTPAPAGEPARNGTTRQRIRAEGKTDRPKLAAPSGGLTTHQTATSQITQQTVDDLRTVMRDDRMTAQQDYATWIAVLSALCGTFAQASPFADELEAIALEYGEHGETYAGETADKIKAERANFNRSNPTAIFNLARGFGIENPATLRNGKNRLRGTLERFLDPHEVEALERINETYAHTLAGGKSVLVYRKMRRIGDADVWGVDYLYAQELEKMMDHEPAIYGYNIKPDKDGVEQRKKGKPVNPARAWTHYPGHNFFPGGIEFYPDPTKCPSDVFNLFRGYNVAPKRGDVELWLELVEDVICSGNRDYANCVIGYFAHMVQKPDERPGYAIVLRGDKGIGKGSVMKPFRHMLGEHYTQLQGLKHLAGRFNGGIVAGKLLIFVDEARCHNSQEEDALKVIITEPAITQERKGIDPEDVSNYARVVMASNHESVVRASENERRYLYLDVSREYQDKDNPDNAAFWRDYYAWADSPDGAAALLDYLQHYDLTGFDPRRAPKTEALQSEMGKNLPDNVAFIQYELAQPVPFRICPTREKWEAQTDQAVITAENMGIRGNTPINSGGVLSLAVGGMCARWINEHVNRYSTEKKTEPNVRQPLSKLFREVFGITSERVNGCTSYVFPDINRARVQFAKYYGWEPLYKYPESEYPGMADAVAQMKAEQPEYDD